MVLSNPVKSNKYLQYFESNVHVAHIPSSQMEEPALSLV
jgi:hypothetical protein